MSTLNGRPPESTLSLSNELYSTLGYSKSVTTRVEALYFTQSRTRVAGTKIGPSRSLPINAVLPCLRQSSRPTKLEAMRRAKNWQQRTAAGSGSESQPLNLDETIFVLATLADPDAGDGSHYSQRISYVWLWQFITD